MTPSLLHPPIPRPSATAVQSYLARWRAGNNEKLDAASTSLFETMPYNTDVGETAVKVAALNGLYATNIFGVVQVATHIVNLGIDARLADDNVDANLVEGNRPCHDRGQVAAQLLVCDQALRLPPPGPLPDLRLSSA